MEIGEVRQGGGGGATGEPQAMNQLLTPSKPTHAFKCKIKLDANP